jgi:hypothetical protein
MSEAEAFDWLAFVAGIWTSSVGFAAWYALRLWRRRP